MIAAVLLAAGSSTRLGTPKQLLLFQGEILLAHVAKTICKSQVDKTVVVLGHRAKEVREKLKEFHVSFVYNPDYAKGQSTSLKTGLAALGNSVDAVLFVLGDQPLLQTDTINKIIDKYKAGNKTIVAPFYRGQRGNPVLFDKKHFTELAALSGDTGARKIIEQYQHQLTRVDVDDPGIIIDVDTWEDYRRLTGFEQEENEC